jgi:tetratricopeptide (TPR) repeat protein
MSQPRVIKVFIASPSDLATERRAFKAVVDDLNKGFGRGAQVTFEPLGWEDILASTGPRSQSVINRDLDSCDIFILVFWRRWGQKAPDAKPYSSYTEEEFYRALARYEKDGKPRICVFFKHVDAPSMADPGRELRKVLRFRKKLEKTRKVIYRMFENEQAFREEIDQHLTAFVRGEIDVEVATRTLPLIPDSIQKELNSLRVEADRAKQEAKKAWEALKNPDAARRVAETSSAAESLKLAEEAANAALDGRLEEARQSFAKALDWTTNLRVLELGFQFFERIGEIAEAERLVRRSLAISGSESTSVATARAFANQGIVMQLRGKLEESETSYRKSLQISQRLRAPDAIADAYAGLGVVLQARGDWNAAKRMHQNALRINKKLVRLSGMADAYACLGVIARNEGDLKVAEKMQRQALKINIKLDRPEGIADASANLGTVLRTLGRLNEAEAMYSKALDIDKTLGRLEAIASEYYLIGAIKKDLRDIKCACENWLESLAMFRRLGATSKAEKVEAALHKYCSSTGKAGDSARQAKSRDATKTRPRARKRRN